MRLQEIMEQGFTLCAWAIKTIRGERYVMVKISKKTPHGEKFYVAHSPQLDVVLKNVEFTEPALIK
ncbi:MAG: hypothetical protein WC348_04865 [Patescibacteria group bacterium]